jgi:pimeloyl-ACP methyl ester carboxylesterase
VAIRRKRVTQLSTQANEPLARLVRFEAGDGATLAGLLFEPERATKRVAVFLHGTGGSSVFESKRTNILAAALTGAGVAYFPFNNRGAQVIRRVGDDLGGYSYERIRDCVHDLDGALRELRRRGYRDITLIGHSTGANKIAVYDHYQPGNPARRYVLLGGGDDTGMLYRHLGPRRFARALEQARERVRAKRGNELVPPSFSELPMSWRSFYDMANPDGDYNVFPFLEADERIRLSRRPRFRYLRALRKPSLFLYGDHDEYATAGVSRSIALLATALGAKPNIEIATMEDADHGFSGREEELAEVIVRWMS